MRRPRGPVGYRDLLFDLKGHRFHPGRRPAWHQWKAFNLSECPSARQRTPAGPLRRKATNLAALNKEKKRPPRPFSLADGKKTVSSIPLCCHLANGSRDSGRKISTILPSCVVQTLLIIRTHRGLKTSATTDAHKHTRHQSPFPSTPFIEVFIKCHRLFTEPCHVWNVNNAEGQIFNNSPTAIGERWFPMTHFFFFLFLTAD